MSSQGVKDGHIEMRDLHWSPAEKAIARKAFEDALGRELQVVIDEVKKRVNEIEETSELWELERYLTERRKEIDRTYDYRYSMLPIVFGKLIREGRFDESELRGLGDDKLAHIRSIAVL
jgi:hypothetical protein